MKNNSSNDRIGPPKAYRPVGKAVGHGLAISSDKQGDQKQVMASVPGELEMTLWTSSILPRLKENKKGFSSLT